jgi:hypothetical protein
VFVATNLTFQTKFNHSRIAPPTPSFIFRSEPRSEQPKNESNVFYILALQFNYDNSNQEIRIFY